MSLPISIVCEKCGTVNETTVSDYMLSVHRTDPAVNPDGKIEIIRDGERDFVVRAVGYGTWFLTPEKCLDLLAALDGYRETFERLAKEQAPETQNAPAKAVLPPAFSLDISKRPGVNWSKIVGRQAWVTDVHERTKEQEE